MNGCHPQPCASGSSKERTVGDGRESGPAEPCARVRSRARESGPEGVLGIPLEAGDYLRRL